MNENVKELDDTLIGQRKNDKRKNRVSELWGTIKKSNIYYFGVLEGKRK